MLVESGAGDPGFPRDPRDGEIINRRAAINERASSVHQCIVGAPGPRIVCGRAEGAVLVCGGAEDAVLICVRHSARAAVGSVCVYLSHAA